MAEVYVLDKHNNYIPSMTKEEIIAAIQTAAAGGSLEGFDNCSFVTKVKEINKNAALGFWVGTQAEYNALATRENNVLYLISDDQLKTDITKKYDALADVVNGFDVVVKTQGEKVDEQSEAIEKFGETIAGYDEKIAEYDEKIAEYDKKIAEFNSLPKLGYTTLYSGDNADYQAAEGIDIAEGYDEFEFLIFQFHEIASGGVTWSAFFMLPTLGITNNTKYGLYFTFAATVGRCVVMFNTANKTKLVFSNSSDTSMRLAAIYGYIRKGGA